MTGTIRPSSTATATPMLIRRLASRPCSVQWALNVGLRLSASADGLDDERDEAEPDPLLRLVVALGLLAERDEARDVDLHLDVGVRRLERAGHLRRDALAHLGHRDEDLVGALRERDRRAGAGAAGAGAAPGAGGGRGRRRGAAAAAAAGAAGAAAGAAGAAAGARRRGLAADRLAGPLAST